VPPRERCRNDARGACLNPACVNAHSKFNKLSTELCNAHMTPGMWCEAAYELNGHGCPYLHQAPPRQFDRDTAQYSGRSGKGGPRSPVYGQSDRNPRNSAQSPGKTLGIPTDRAGISCHEQGARRATNATTSTNQKTSKGGLNLPPRNKSRHEQAHSRQPHNTKGTRRSRQAH
jgi:hypothetical protein